MIYCTLGGQRLQKLFDYEHEQRMKLEDMVEQLAKDQVSLESQAKNSLKSVKKGAEIGIYLDYSLIIS
jgi:cell division protein FtsB